MVDNDNNARYSLGGLATTGVTMAGTNQDAVFIYGQHSW